MNPTTRRLQLLGLLQSRPEWSGDVLAERLGVSTRTLRRDVSLLRDLGYAIDSEHGYEGGYRLAGGGALPPLVLDDEEAVAVALGLRSAAANGVAGLDDAAMSALAKLDTALPSRLRARVSALGSGTVQLTRAGFGSAAEPETLATLALACHRGERYRIRYRDRTGNVTRRDVDPYRVVRTVANWYLVARDVAKDAWRTFRIDRISEPQAVGVRVHLEESPDAAALVAEAVALGGHERQVTVRLHAPVNLVRRFITPTDGVLEAEGDDTTLLRVGGDHPWWIARFLVWLCCPFEVLDAPEVVEELHKLGAELSTIPATET